MNKTLKNYLILFLTFMKIGLFTFGGGYAMVALLEDEVINKKGWIKEEELVDMVAIAESTPGPIAINIATYTGYKVLGVLGAIVSTLGVTIPSLAIIFVIASVFSSLMEYTIIQHAFMGIKCAVAILIIAAGIKLLKKMNKDAVSIIIFSLTFIAMLLIDIFSINFSSIYLILIGGLIGLVTFIIQKSKRNEDKNNGSTN